MAEKQDIPVSEQIQAEIDRRKMVLRSKKHLSLVWVHPVRRTVVLRKVCKNEQK